MKYLLLINCLLITELSFADPGIQEKKEEFPVIVISRDQVDQLGNVNVAQLLKFINAKLPVSKENITHAEIVDQINKTDNKIIEDTGDMILVQSFAKNKENGENQPIFRTQYLFKDGMLTNGPIFKITEDINGIKVIGERLKKEQLNE